MPPPAAPPDASVVIPTRDRPGDLERVLAALRRQRTDRRFEVVVVDDGSEPPVPEQLLDALPESRLVRSGGRGPAAARNLGARNARGEILLFTDDDTEPAEAWVESACRFLDEHPDHAGVEGPIASPPYDPLYEHSLVNERPGAYWTANMAYRADAFARLGGFEESFPDPHCEDLDLAFRALRVAPLGFAEGMAVLHFPRPLPLRRLIARARLTRSEILLFERHRERYGRASRLPPRAFPAVSAVHSWWLAVRREGFALLLSPRRLGRFVVGAAAHMATVAASALTAPRRRRGA